MVCDRECDRRWRISKSGRKSKIIDIGSVLRGDVGGNEGFEGGFLTEGYFLVKV